MAVPTLPAPAMATFMPTPLPARAVRSRGCGEAGAAGAADVPPRRALNRSRAVSVTIRWRTSPSWPTRSPKSSRATPARVTATT